MTRIIKASEVKPGMEVEFTLTRRMKVCYSYRWNDFEHGLEGVSGDVTFVDADTQVTVLSEPAPAQPEEPTEFGVKARVREGRFLRLREGLEGSNVWFEEGTGYRWTWDDLCEMGPVTVVPDQGWTAPDAPEVPDQIEKWDAWEDVPEGVTVSNPVIPLRYRKAHGRTEVIGSNGRCVWSEKGLPLGDYPGPWTRVTVLERQRQAP